MSKNLFNNNTSNNPFLATANPFLSKNNNNQQNQQTQTNSIINNNNISSLNNLNQGQKTQDTKNSIFQTSNITFGNNLISTNSQTNNLKKDDNNPFNSTSFLNLNQTQNNNIFTNQNNINKEESKTNPIKNINTNLTTNNNLSQNNNNIINTNNSNINKDTSSDFFNIQNKNIGNSNNAEKKEENNIFLAKSNNFLNKSNNNPNGNNDKNNEKNKVYLNFENNNKGNNNEINSLFEGMSKNKNDVQSQNIDKKEERKKVDMFLNNVFQEYKFISSEQEMNEFMKNQMLHQFGGEVLNEMKLTLESQKKTYHECVKSTRDFEERYYQLCKMQKEEAEFALQNQFRYEKLLEQLNNLCRKTNELEEKIILKKNDISQVLDYLNKKNNNKNMNNDINNNLNYIKTIEFEDKNQFYKGLMESSKKLRKFEDELNIISTNFERNQKNMSERDEFYEKYNHNNGLFSFYNNMEGVWIERNNNKIYVEQKEMDEIYNDCYNGLNGLINEDEEIIKRCDRLKNRIIEKISKNNNKIENNRDNFNMVNINDINIKNLININNINNTNNINNSNNTNDNNNNTKNYNMGY